MDRRRMMMDEKYFTVAMDFSDSEDEKAFVEYCKRKYTGGFIKCKKGLEIICRISGAKRGGKIIFNGEEIPISVLEPFCRIRVETNLDVVMNGPEMHVSTVL